MEKYIDADKVKAEIERRIRELDEQIVDIYDSKAVLRKDELQRLLSFLDTLKEEPNMDLEKEIEKEWEALEKDYSPSALDKSHIIVSGLVGRKQFSRIAHHFYELCKNSK